MAIKTPDGIDIPSLRQRKQEQYFNLMQPGVGTPWEERGSTSLPGAFIKTVLMSLMKPAELFNAIRRPDTSGDARSFAIICCVFWGLAAIVHESLMLGGYRDYGGGYSLNENAFWRASLVEAAIVGVGAYFLLKLSAIVYFKMISHELRGTPPPPVLLFNIFAYAMGPSILAPIPFIGPPLALVWILVLMAVAGRKRMHVTSGGAVVATVSVALVVGTLIGAGYVLKRMALWHALSVWNYTEPPPAKTP